MRTTRLAAPAVLSACVLALAACGDDEKATDSSSASSGKSDVASVDPASIASAKGKVTLCAPALTVKAAKAAVKQAADEASGLTVKVITLPEDANQQNTKFRQRQEAKSGECDVFESDVVWTAQFASKNWLLNLDEYVKGRESEFIPSTLETAKYNGTYFGVPEKTDTGFLYRRTDRVKKAPATWQDLYATAKKAGGFVYQGSSYEGLTVNYLEVAYAAGGKVLSDDGTKSEINSPENLKALKLMVDGIKSGAAPKATLTYKEGESQAAFDSGKPGYMRNWPYAYSLEKESKTKGLKKNFAVTPLPSFEGGGTAGVLGGSNLVISAYSKNPSGSLKLIDLLTNEASMRLRATKLALGPVLEASYSDKKIKKAIPFLATFKKAVEQAQSRPVSPVYTAVSTAISKNVSTALSGDVTPEAALEAADKEINSALSTF